MTDTRGTILIIDDDLSLQAMLDMALRKENYTVIAAHDGQEGLELIETLQPNLIISDIMMPNMDGVEMFQHIKERLQDDGIPIIVITALTPKPWFAEMEAEGAAIFQKPFEINKLVDLINMLLE